MNITKFISNLFILVVFVVSCEEESTSATHSPVKVNTLNDSDLGFEESTFTDYYYDLNSDFSAKFLYYQKESPSGNTILTPTTLKVNLDTLNFRTFSDYILKVEPEDIGSSTEIELFDEIGDGCLWIQGPEAEIHDTSYVDNDGVYDYDSFLHSATDFCPDIDGDGNPSDENIFPNKPQVDSLIMHSHQFNSLDWLEWDTDDNRYKPQYKDFPDTVNNTPIYTSSLKSDTTLYYNCKYNEDDSLIITGDANLYDSLIYVTPIDAVITEISGQIYLDDSEYIQRDSVFTSSNIELSTVFEFEVNVLSADSIMFKKNTDCNQDGMYTEAELTQSGVDGCEVTSDCDWESGYICDSDVENSSEEDEITYGVCFIDRANGKFDLAEIYLDKSNNGTREGSEPFEDLNCNASSDGITGWDAAELTSSDTSEENCTETLEGVWLTIGGITFCDIGNGQWDDNEHYEGEDPDPEKLYQLVSAPVVLLVDYTDTDFCGGNLAPVALGKIEVGIEMKLRDCTDYIPIISSSISDPVLGYIPMIDSITTTFSNEIIAQIAESSIQDKEFFIMKSEFLYTNEEIRKYNYTILNDDEHMVQLGYPSYFKPYGFYFSPSQIEDGFWYEDFLTLDVLYYIYDGRIRQGEHVVLDSIYVTSHGDYNVEIDTYVEKPESIAVPMRKLLYDENLNNGEVCRLETDPYPSCADEFSLSAFDTTFTDCYSIIKTVTMTMIGSGVEYGERTTTYLARGLGVVNEKVEVRWSERIGFDGEDWSNYSELKLNDFRHIGSDLGRSKGILEELIGQKKINIEQLDQLDGDPFIKGRSTGIQSIRLPSNY